MEQVLKLLSNSALFNGFSHKEIASALLCLNGKVKSYTRRQRIRGGDEPLNAIGIILSGIVYVSKENEIGGQAIYYEAREGDMIGEPSMLTSPAQHSFAQDELAEDGLTIVALEDCEILLIESKNIMSHHERGTVCTLRSRVIENLLKLIISNNIDLHQKLDLMSQRSLRSRIMYYLRMQARRQQSNSFQIPFSRAEFAEYLLVDRSALSRELCRMEEDGLISFTRNRFTLLD